MATSSSRALGFSKDFQQDNPMIDMAVNPPIHNDSYVTSKKSPEKIQDINLFQPNSTF